MTDQLQFYIGGQWVDPVSPAPFDVINPATEQPFARISLGGEADVERAVAAARTAFDDFSRTDVAARIALLEAIIDAYKARVPELAEAISNEMGAPMWLAASAQALSGLGHLMEAVRYLKDYPFEEVRGATLIRREPIGVCALITPWNWPANQIACKVAPAIAAGCTMVLKPSEVAPLSAMVFARIMEDAGAPAGVFNLVNGDGPTVGAALSRHADVDMVSFTGSTRAGVQVAQAAATTVKRVTQELGGKSPNIILPDANIAKAVASGVRHMMQNSGQSCNAPSRMFVPRAAYDLVKETARSAAMGVKVQPPHSAERGAIGPVVSKTQYDRIQWLIQSGISEGATVLAGGPGRPDELQTGYYVRPTVFADVTNDMTIAREEIFGPVLSIIAYDTVDDAVAMANDTQYGLSAYVQSGTPEAARAVAARLRAGNVHLNGAGLDQSALFGGYKQSGNGREFGVFGLEEYLETKAVLGHLVTS